MDASKDREIWTLARNDGWTIITKDEDFVQLATVDPAGAPVVWLRVGNCRKQFLLEWFSRLFPAIIHELTNGEQIVEVI